MFTDNTNLLDKKQGYYITIDESCEKSTEVHLYIDMTGDHDIVTPLMRQLRSNVVPTLWIETGMQFKDYDGNYNYRCGINPSQLYVNKIGTDKQLEMTFCLDKEREYYDVIRDFLLYENWKPVITMSNIIHSISLEKCSQTTVK